MNNFIKLCCSRLANIQIVARYCIKNSYYLLCNQNWILGCLANGLLAMDVNCRIAYEGPWSVTLKIGPQSTHNFFETSIIMKKTWNFLNLEIYVNSHHAKILLLWYSYISVNIIKLGDFLYAWLFILNYFPVIFCHNIYTRIVIRFYKVYVLVPEVGYRTVNLMISIILSNARTHGFLVGYEQSNWFKVVAEW